MKTIQRLLSTCAFLSSFQLAHASAPTDTPRDADIGQTSYVGSTHNISPSTLPQFTHLWNATFNPDEKVLFLHPRNTTI